MNIYCQKCGSKHQLGAKFCSSCGNSLTGGQPAAQKRTTSVSNSAADDEDDPPENLVIPSKLDYTIIQENKNRFTVAEALSRPPSEETNRDVRIPNRKKLSLKEFEQQSMKECGRSATTEIDE